MQFTTDSNVVDFSKRRLFTRQADNTIRLPWVADTQSFTDLCTRCGECARVCDTQIIVSGDGGFPTVDFSIDECTFCYRCADVCQEQIFLTEAETPWHAKASINETCLAKQNVECRSCGELCEPMAIQFKLEVGKVAQPHISHDKCSGCGACVAVCPSSSINVSN